MEKSLELEASFDCPEEYSLGLLKLIYKLLFLTKTRQIFRVETVTQKQRR